MHAHLWISSKLGAAAAFSGGDASLVGVASWPAVSALLLLATAVLLYLQKPVICSTIPFQSKLALVIKSP